jgi:hypothetical protein
MTNNQHAKKVAAAQHQEPCLFTRMIRIWKLDRLLIEEHTLSFLERDVMFLPV